MKKIVSDLIKIANTSLSKDESLQIKKIASSLIKVSDFGGFQGSWIRNDNWKKCYVKSRAKNPEKSSQEIIQDCWNEYHKSINKENDAWDKYASSENSIFDIALEKNALLEKEIVLLEKLNNTKLSSVIDQLKKEADLYKFFVKVSQSTAINPGFFGGLLEGTKKYLGGDKGKTSVILDRIKRTSDLIGKSYNSLSDALSRTYPPPNSQANRNMRIQSERKKIVDLANILNQESMYFADIASRSNDTKLREIAQSFMDTTKSFADIAIYKQNMVSPETLKNLMTNLSRVQMQIQTDDASYGPQSNPVQIGTINSAIEQATKLFGNDMNHVLPEVMRYLQERHISVPYTPQQMQAIVSNYMKNQGSQVAAAPSVQTQPGTPVSQSQPSQPQTQTLINQFRNQSFWEILPDKELNDILTAINNAMASKQSKQKMQNNIGQQMSTPAPKTTP